MSAGYTDSGHGDALCHITENNLGVTDAGVHGDVFNTPVSVGTTGVKGTAKVVQIVSRIQSVYRGYRVRVKMKKTEALLRLADQESHTQTEHQKIVDSAEAAKVEAAAVIAALQLKVAALQLKVKTLESKKPQHDLEQMVPVESDISGLHKKSTRKKKKK